MPSRIAIHPAALVRRPADASPLHTEIALPGMRIGLFGGSFNPPHEGHLHVARTARRRLGLDSVWWLVSPQNPLKGSKDTAAYERRLDQVRALADEPGFVVSDLESRLGSPYTIDLVTALTRMRPGVRFAYIVGADNLAALHLWRDWQALFQAVPIAVVARSGDALSGDALRARLSPAAQRFRQARVDASGAAALLQKRPPAWLYLTARLHPASSTVLRERSRAPK